MRGTRYFLGVVVFAITLTSLTYYLGLSNRLGKPTCPLPLPVTSRRGQQRSEGHENVGRVPGQLPCIINGGYEVTCLKQEEQVYIPFSFLENYFQVYGKLSSKNGEEVFEWMHSYSQVYHPEKVYKTAGVYMMFAKYNVEGRERVKCISAHNGVPMSTQWLASGHFYPTQIAQFALTHYSKNLNEDIELETISLVDKLLHTSGTGSEGNHVRRTRNEVGGNLVFEFSAQDNDSPLTIRDIPKRTFLILSTKIYFKNNGSLTATVTADKSGSVYHIHYVPDSRTMWTRQRNIFYGISASDKWADLTRDLRTDLQKAIKSKVRMQLLELSLIGRGFIEDISISNQGHTKMFLAAADWFVNNQNEDGGWPIMATRKLAPGVNPLVPGWYSAMAQGHAMSVLARAYLRTTKTSYLKCAVKAMKVFEVTSDHGGVMAKFMDKYVWYEEYPTQPSSFVLNGFIYSLFGLYDVYSLTKSMEVHQAASSKAYRLYTMGLTSLKAMLPLYDTGSGSVYDLRHTLLGTAPNLARWDYHSVHINQLLVLATIDKDPLWTNVANRWEEYMHGLRAKHN